MLDENSRERLQIRVARTRDIKEEEMASIISQLSSACPVDTGTYEMKSLDVPCYILISFGIGGLILKGFFSELGADIYRAVKRVLVNGSSLPQAINKVFSGIDNSRKGLIMDFTFKDVYVKVFCDASQVASLFENLPHLFELLQSKSVQDGLKSQTWITFNGKCYLSTFGENMDITEYDEQEQKWKSRGHHKELYDGR